MHSKYQKFSGKDERLAELYNDIKRHNEDHEDHEDINIWNDKNSDDDLHDINSYDSSNNNNEIDLIEKTYGNYVFSGSNLDKPPGLRTTMEGMQSHIKDNYLDDKEQIPINIIMNSSNNFNNTNNINFVGNDEDDIAKWRSFDYEFGINHNNNNEQISQTPLMPSQIISQRASINMYPSTPIVPRHRQQVVPSPLPTTSSQYGPLAYEQSNAIYYPPIPRTHQYLQEPSYKKKLPQIREKRLLESCTIQQFENCEKSYNISRSIIAQFLTGHFKKNIIEQNFKKEQQKDNYENFKKKLDIEFKEYICLYSSSSEYQKQLTDILLEYLQTFPYNEDQNYKETALSTFKNFTEKKVDRPRKISVYYNNQEIAKLCCYMGAEMNDILVYLINNYKIDLRIDNDIMLDLCTSANNIAGFKLVFDTILSYGQQINHEFLGDLLIYCAIFGYFEIIKIIFSYELFLNYVHLYLKSAIKKSIENHKYDIFSYLCMYLVINVTDIEIKSKILNRAFVTACSLNESKVFKFLINLQREKELTFVMDDELIINCIQVGSNKIAAILINRILKNLQRKEILLTCEKILMACIRYNQLKLMVSVEKILLTHEKYPRWNKIIKQLFVCKFFETINVKSLKFVLKIMKFYNFKKIHDFDTYIDCCLTLNNPNVDIFQKFLKFIKNNDVPIKINLNNLGSYFEKAFRNGNISSLYFLCSYVYVYHSENNLDFQLTNHFVTPKEFNNVFDVLLEENDLLYAIIEIFGKNFFVKNEIFQERLLKSIDLLDNKHMAIAEACDVNDIDLCLEANDYKFFRLACKMRDVNRVAACLSVHSCCKRDIDFSNNKVKKVMDSLAYTCPLLLYKIKESTVYKAYWNKMIKNKNLSKTKHEIVQTKEIAKMNKNLTDANLFFTQGTVLGPNTCLNNVDVIKIDSDDSDSSYDTDDTDCYAQYDTEKEFHSSSSSSGNSNSDEDEDEDENEDEYEYETIKFESIPSHIEPIPDTIKLTLDDDTTTNNIYNLTNDNSNSDENEYNLTYPDNKSQKNDLIQFYSSLRQSFDQQSKNLHDNFHQLRGQLQELSSPSGQLQELLPFHKSLPLPINDPPPYNPPSYNSENETISGSPPRDPSPLSSSLFSIEKTKYKIYDYDPNVDISYINYNAY